MDGEPKMTFINKFSFFFVNLKVINYKLQECDKHKRTKKMKITSPKSIPLKKS